jgi:hypothetical protein
VGRINLAQDGVGGGSCEHSNEPSRCMIDMLGSSRVNAQLVASEAGFGSMTLVS